MRLVFALAAAAVTSFAVPALAQEPNVNCKDPQTQMEMTYCAEQDFNTADKALNSEYQKIRKIVKARDADAEPNLKGAEDALVKAQRAWVAYRDSQCTSYGYQARGGSMEPQLIYSCRADLTRKRTTELKELTEAMGN